MELARRASQVEYYLGYLQTTELAQTGFTLLTRLVGTTVSQCLGTRKLHSRIMSSTRCPIAYSRQPPVGHLVFYAYARVANITFSDKDGDALELGGNITRLEPRDSAQDRVSGYRSTLR